VPSPRDVTLAFRFPTFHLLKPEHLDMTRDRVRMGTRQLGTHDFTADIQLFFDIAKEYGRMKMLFLKSWK